MVAAIIMLIAKFAGPKLAGAIGGIPVVFAVSYVIITMSNKTVAKGFLVGGIYGAIAGIFFSLVLLWLNAHFLKTHWVNFAVAYALCFLFALLLVQVTSKS